MILCPFRSGTTGQPPNSLNATTDFTGHNCVGDGEFDNTTNIGLCLTDAVSVGKTLFFPAGTYLVTDSIVPPNNASIQGAGQTTIIYMANQGSWANVFLMTSKSGVSIASLMVDSNTGAEGSFIIAFKIGSCTNITLSNLLTTDLHYGIKVDDLGGGDTSGLTVTNFTATNCAEPMLVSDCHDSTFTNINLTANSDNVSYGNHVLYITHECYDIYFDYLTLTGGYGRALHCYVDSGASARLNFDHVTANATKYCVVLMGNLSYITIANSHLHASSANLACVHLDTVDNVTISDFTAEGGSALVGTYDSETSIATNILFDIGTYTGDSLVYNSPQLPHLPSLTFTNVTLI